MKAKSGDGGAAGGEFDEIASLMKAAFGSAPVPSAASQGSVASGVEVDAGDGASVVEGADAAFMRISMCFWRSSWPYVMS